MLGLPFLVDQAHLRTLRGPRACTRSFRVRELLAGLVTGTVRLGGGSLSARNRVPLGLFGGCLGGRAMSLPAAAKRQRLTEDEAQENELFNDSQNTVFQAGDPPMG